MTHKKLNSSGVAHHFLLAFIIVSIGIFGAYKVVLSHAQTPYKNSYACPSQPELSTAHPTENPTCTKYVQAVIGAQATGIFDAKTKVAVQRFQFTNHVGGSSCAASQSTCDGIVGQYTWTALNASNAKQLKAASAKTLVKPSPVSTDGPSGTVSCTESTVNTVSVNIQYAKATPAKPVTLERNTTVLETFTDGSAVSFPRTYLGMAESTQYNFQLRSGKQVLSTAHCKTTAPPRVLTCLDGFTKNANGDCLTQTMTTQPVCVNGSTLVTIKAAVGSSDGDQPTDANSASIDAYYCQQNNTDDTPRRIDGPVVHVSCSYYKGNPLVKVIDRLHTRAVCNGIHRVQATYAPCTFVNPAGKTVNEIHSAKWCAARHKEHPVATATQQVARVTCSPGTTVDNGVSVSDATVKVHYDNASSASPLILYRNKTPIATYTDGNQTKVKIDINLSAGTTYVYQVRSGSKVLSTTNCKTL